jgi:hypothetical protein
MGHVKSAIGYSTKANTADAVDEALKNARAALGVQPGLCFLTATVDHAAAAVDAGVRARLGAVPLHGITTSLGLLTSKGVQSDVVGVLLFGGDDAVRFGVGSATIDKDARASGNQAARELQQRGGGTPKVIFVNASPGLEEDVLAGVAEVLPGVPAWGGSAADHAIAGQWSVFTDRGPEKNAVSLAGFFGDVKVGGAFVAPYRPSGPKAVVTAAHDRRLETLGGESAAKVLDGWLGGTVATQVKNGGNVLAQTALKPIARYGTNDHWITIHPAHIHKDGTVDVFARVSVGDEVCAMEATGDELLAALAGLAARAEKDGGFKPGEAQSAFLIHCAGCAAALGDRVDVGVRALGDKLGGVPVFGLCTFGEQGYVKGVGNLHQDLSLALVLIG